MSDKIRSCFMDDNLDFTMKLSRDGVDMGVIRALTPEDYDIIRIQADVEYQYDKEKDQIKMRVNEGAKDSMRILLSFGGEYHKKSYKRSSEGWIFDRECTLENVNLLDKETRRYFLKKIDDLEKRWENSVDGTAKN